MKPMRLLYSCHEKVDEMPLHIQERNIRDIVILDLYGNLDFNTSPELKVRLDSHIKFGHQKIIINLASVDFIDSTGVGSLMYALKLLDSTMGDIKIIGLSPQNQNVFTVLELDRVFSIMNSETQAISSFLEDDATLH
jgi:anti-sigma B factor antagonist